MPEKTSEEVIKKVVAMRIEQGFINEDLEPVKCRICGSKKMVDYDHYREGHGVIEYSVKCGECNAVLGHWAYGNWSIEYLF